MSCVTFEERVSELARADGRDMIAADWTSTLAHVETCVRCRTRLVDERRLSRALASVAAASAGFEAPASLESVILRTYRARRTAVTRRSPTWPRWTARLAAAAMVGLVVAVVGTGRRPDTEERSPGASLPVPSNPARPSAPPAVLSTESILAMRPAEVAPSPSVAPGPRARGRSASAPLPAARTLQRGRATTPSMADFAPWLWADSVTDFDRGQVVRVGLPRSALASWGWPLEGDVADEDVETELLLGEDGMARAIRVVR
jgi:hypothetical protein